MQIIRFIFGPLILRFYNEDALRQALEVLEISKATDAEVPRWMRNRAKRIIARELIRRNIFFWEA